MIGNMDNMNDYQQYLAERQRNREQMNVDGWEKFWNGMPSPDDLKKDPAALDRWSGDNRKRHADDMRQIAIFGRAMAVLQLAPLLLLLAILALAATVFLTGVPPWAPLTLMVATVWILLAFSSIGIARQARLANKITHWIVQGRQHGRSEQ